jgi:hypothetical protein
MQTKQMHEDTTDDGAPHASGDTPAERPALRLKLPEEKARETAEESTGRKPVVLPRIDPARGGTPFATHGRAPAAEDEVEPDTKRTPRGDRLVSTGFLLGVGLIAAALTAGLFIVKLQKRVRLLEGRIEALEQTSSQTSR